MGRGKILHIDLFRVFYYYIDIEKKNMSFMNMFTDQIKSKT